MAPSPRRASGARRLARRSPGEGGPATGVRGLIIRIPRKAWLVVGVVPAGETEAQAEDRLATLDSTGRARVEAEARAAEERAREVRAAMERQRAAEAAARASRE